MNVKELRLDCFLEDLVLLLLLVLINQSQPTSLIAF
jgi:hypothetical protein